MKVRFWRLMIFGKLHDHAIKQDTFVFINVLLLLLLWLFPSIVVSQRPSNPSLSPSSPNDETGRYRFSPAMSVIFVVIVVVFFVVGCFSVFAGRCIESSSPRSSLFTINQVNRRSRRARHQGLDPNVIDTFPTFLYSDVKKVRIIGKGNSGLECSICLNEFQDEETLRLLPKCCHVFHPECIDTWLISQVTCPVCRADLVPVPGETGTNNCNFLSRDLEDDSNRPNWIEEECGQVHVREISETDIELDSSSDQVTKSIQLRSNSQIRQPVEGKFPRSHSTGHSVIRPWDDYERFTLRLPQDVQKKLMKAELGRAKSNLVLPSASSPKRGFRSSSVGPGLELPIHNSFDHEGRRDRWGFSVAPPFFTRSRSVVQAPIGISESGSSSKPVKSSSFDWLFGATSSKDETGERSFARLIGKHQV